ncbi:serine/threonine-protein phosphatase 6 regulatory subunit 3 isoform X1 [Polistes fuscatus]|uniref:serine/threonine-protein phosphatase 6 regulatory subunit 3 isoform X1 n=1 Tax=Polistes fuscatus TaxID=30207 RepID=UPI001CA80C31|nr:serine/threonine-protein phosphatase 6 regulatory subunit 3 isoform X1 [Polistes fuscatus]XP_043504031.1 serine/threonine-protein phosphatase 6 regulatory subunit 3 isoform X1 [Polistes fuscatus]XP_043504039.1 serine/threonine-protein phosphatase 6 regulatory subunit 3 isoform X1 [Polistes fuscatus]XP_043504047.1 serine/threonine-protein phosphatase 6 regulatory subunit 3 isoform X1 [Polistes fuscatus]XP_043504052.1 serine/threonine-protein phosphatase 6 regulatory subunit 3 isoform X1 [Poli
MFWTNNYVSSPHIEALLNKENVTLHELMDEEDILQECKSQNKKLIEYLVRPDVMEELVMLTTMEPSIDIEERLRYKYPNVACELLTCDVPTLNEKLAGDKTLLNKLYAFIDTDQPLNPLLASFFSKTIGVLVARKSDQNWYSYQFTCLQVIEFLQGQQNCVDLLLQHLETSAIMDLILKLVTQVEGGHLRQNILNWLDSQQLVQRLIKLLSPTSEPTKHANASQLLCDMVIVARENQRTSTEQIKPGPILNTLKSEETVSLLLETILTSEKSESSIVGGIQVLLTLLGQKVNTALNEVDIHGNGSNEDMTDDNEQCINISNATIPYLEQLHKLLLDPPVKAPVKTTAGILDCPLGKTRLHVARLLMALLSTENVKIHEALADLGTFQTLLDLFFKYTWNNFLHTQVQQCLALAINCDYQDNNNIYSNIFVKCRLIERILEAWEKNENKQNKENGIRQGYMGHLINIANNIVLQCEKNNALDTFVKTNLSTECLNKWEILVNTKLVEINKTRAIFLIRPTANMPNSEDTPDRYYLKEMYTDYQGQQMTSTFIDNFGFRDNQFDAGDDSLHSSADEITALAFKRINLADEEMDPRADLFDKICQQKQKAGLEECGGGAEWTDEGDLTFQTVVDKRDWHSKQHHGSSSSDEDDEDPRDMPMEIDTSDVWNFPEPIPANTTIPEVNPWDVVPSEPLESTGWANFDNFESTLSIENNIAVDNKTYETVTKDIVDAATSLVEKETALENKSVENIGGGDSITVDLVDSTSHLSTEANQNSKASDDSIYSVCTSDKNANPSERTPETREDSKNEYVKNSIENDKTLTENKIVCAVQSTPSDTTLMSKDAK